MRKVVFLGGIFLAFLPVAGVFSKLYDAIDIYPDRSQSGFKNDDVSSEGIQFNTIRGSGTPYCCGVSIDSYKGRYVSGVVGAKGYWAKTARGNYQFFRNGERVYVQVKKPFIGGQVKEIVVAFARKGQDGRWHWEDLRKNRPHASSDYDAIWEKSKGQAWLSQDQEEESLQKSVLVIEVPSSNRFENDDDLNSRTKELLPDEDELSRNFVSFRKPSVLGEPSNNGRSVITLQSASDPVVVTGYPVLTNGSIAPFNHVSICSDDEPSRLVSTKRPVSRKE